LFLTMLTALGSPAAVAGGGLCPSPPPVTRVDVAAPAAATETRAAAERVSGEGGVLVLEGDVGVRRGPWTLGAERAVHDRRRGAVRAGGDFFVRDDAYSVRAERGELALETGALTAEGVDYRLLPDRMQGRASRVERSAEGVTQLSEATWSTCPAAREAWYLSADAVTLDPANRQGTARNAALWFHGVPMLYSPWFRFPLGSQRLTGFLTPTVGRTSNSGIEIAVPWYWNIAPDLDATFTPRWLGRRGVELNSEVRWLGPLGQWRFDNAYLDDDRVTGGDRVYTRIEQEARFGAWRTRIDAARVSDGDYFADLGDDLSSTSQTHLERRADLRWASGRSDLLARAQSYQTLDPTLSAQQRPYAQLPRLEARHAAALGAGAESAVTGELVRFERAASTTGTRLRLVPELTWPLEAPGWFVRPRVAVDHTHYSLDRREGTSGPERIDRTVPITSLDTGLIFDRFGGAYQQTLEPRLFYVYIPEREQAEIPLFDTSDSGFSFSQLFRERRFTGGDRIGDTDQITLALTSRVLDRFSGRELLSARIGAIRYLDERRVTLAQRRPEEPIADETSDILSEVSITPNRQWQLDGSFQWTPERDELARRDLGVRFRGDEGGIFNLGHRFKRDQQRQLDASMAWPATAQWQLLAGTTYSLLDERNIESVAGVTYESCCWRLRTVARQFLQQDDDAADGTKQSTALLFQLTFKGLGAVGDEAGALLERAIVGYDVND
jgi:LPS-assembly protein